MSITVQFKDFEEMVAFAKMLLNGYQIEPKPETVNVSVVRDEVTDKKVEKSPVDEKIVAELSKSETSMNTAPVGIEDEEEPVKTYKLEEVRAELAKLTRAGKQKEVKELLTSFGAKNLSSVDPKDYAALMEKAGEI
jgi:hypothetical protein